MVEAQPLLHEHIEHRKDIPLVNLAARFHLQQCGIGADRADRRSADVAQHAFRHAPAERFKADVAAAGVRIQHHTAGKIR